MPAAGVPLHKRIYQAGALRATVGVLSIAIALRRFWIARLVSVRSVTDEKPERRI